MGIRVRAEGRSALLRDTEFVVGRSSYCSLILDHPSVSRLHASLKPLGDQIVLSDLGSTNGTFLNNNRLEGSVETSVRLGDQIRVGEIVLVLEEVPDRPLGLAGTYEGRPPDVVTENTRNDIERRK